MSVPGGPPGPPQPARRLHPWSWLFQAAQGLKEVVLSVLVFSVLKHEQPLLVGGVAAAVALLLSAYGWLRAHSFRYEVMADEIVIREGLFTRESRHVPFTRIQSVSERRGPLHRFVDVTELVLESGSGGRPEAVMRVLGSREAALLAERLRLHRSAAAETAGPAAPGRAATPGGPQPGPAAAEPEPGPEPEPERLLALPGAEIVRLGLISNRGFLVVAALLGVVSQNAELLAAVPGADRLAEAFDAGARQAADASVLQLAGWLLVLLALALGVVRVLSVGHAVFTQHGFTLTRSGDRLRVQRGLLTRVDTSGRVSAIQGLVLERTLLHRLFKRCSLRVDLPAAVSTATGPTPRLDHLAPIATGAQADALIRACLPGLSLQALSWQPLHRGAAWRRWQRTLWWLLPLLAAGTVLAGWLPGLPADTGPGVLGLSVALVAASGWHAHRWAAGAAVAVGPGVLVWRSGVFTQRWVMLPLAQAQAVCVRRSPADRRAGTARLSVDTMAQGHRLALDVPWLAEADAAALRARLWPASALSPCPP